MTRRTRALAFALIAACSACELRPGGSDDAVRDTTERTPPLAPDSVRDQVLARLEQYYIDLSARDWDRVRDHFWPGATVTTVWQTETDSVPRVLILTIEQFIEQAPLGPGSREIFEERMTSADVRGNARLAQAWARYDARFGDPGDVQAWSGTDAITLMRHEGRWRIVALAYRSDEN